MKLASPTTPVTLNSYQGPSLRKVPKLAAARSQTSGTGSASMYSSARAANWMLKQVQHDAGFWKADHA